LISKETGVNEKVVYLIIKHFHKGIRKILYKNGDISIHGLFKITMKKPYRKKVDADPNINLRKRKFK
jgi:hypothetical protein